MAVMLFTVLNGLGVVFLLYVLIQFWKEGQQPMKQARRGQVIELSVKSKPTVLVVTHPVSGGLQVEPAPVSHSAHGGLSVVSRQARMAVLQDSTPHGDSVNGAGEVPMKRFSTR
jgi:hypothetical protein